MDTSDSVIDQKGSFQRLVDASIRIVLIFLLAAWCIRILWPFLMPVLWGVILSVALFPGYRRLEGVLGGRRKLASIVFALLGLTFLIVPSYFFFASLVEGSSAIVDQLNAGTLEVPPPADSVKTWPLIGEQLHEQWLAASQDQEGAFKKWKPQILAVVKSIVHVITGLGGDLLLFIIAVLIASVFLATSASGVQAFRSIFTKLVGERGDELAKLTSDTIVNVAKGVVGVAIIQTTLCGIGLLVAGIPVAGLWILLILILCVIQLPPVIILIPIIIYQFSQVDTTPAVIFMIWSLVAGSSDTFLKPMFLGRGMKTPMLVILLGAIGGMIWAGIIGLFVGAVVLALGYEFFLVWLQSAGSGEEPAHAEEST
jgi:predicted PurR-regulated permease PerM